MNAPQDPLGALGYEIKQRQDRYGDTWYYWSWAGGEEWSKAYKTRGGAVRTAMKDAKLRAVKP